MAEAFNNAPSIRPLDNSFRFKPKGQFFLQPFGSLTFAKGGDYSAFSLSADIEENEVYSNEYPEKTLVLNDITKADITVSFTARMMTPFLRRVSMLSKKQTFSQTAVSGAEVTVKIPVGEVYYLGVFDATVGGVAYADDDLVLGTDYEVDGPTGAVSLLRAPDGAVPDEDGAVEVTISYSAAAIVNRAAFGFMSDTNIRTAIQFRQKVKWGPQVIAQFWDVQLRPDGEIPLGGDGEDFGEMQFTGRVYADPSKPAGFQLGRALDIPRAA